jgi:hypothetical protein
MSVLGFSAAVATQDGAGAEAHPEVNPMAMMRAAQGQFNLRISKPCFAAGCACNGPSITELFKKAIERQK